MNVWLSIVKKELRMQRGVALVILAALVLVSSLGMWFAFTKNEVASGLFLLIPLALHVFFLPLYMLNSIQKEWKHTSTTFLQMPISGWKLLSAKLVSGLLYFLISFTILFVVCGIAFRVGPDADFWQRVQWEFGAADGENLMVFSQYASLTTQAYLYLLGALLYANLSLVAFTTLFSVVVQWVRNTIRKAAGLITFLVCVGFIWLLLLIADTTVYDKLTRWGQISFSTHGISLGHIYTGAVLIDLLLTVALFLFSGWLIDRKVEV
ncbi:hypothetical protein [Tumebacillus permanentifrigoris]|uniref:ABC-2 family transporter n=1 Tax=Tumebacillus permanentifrigoris TaxID=378543 RepID=A0A316D6B3_9BACL|nr:hypothetical protein [Tumebacillus permanentifrigoris]PWK09577.1 hypothetical protein C7459_11311 [Tumebacillus permanentifrigoris]